MVLVIGSEDIRDCNRIEADKIWGSALVSADEVVATEISEGAVVVAEMVEVDVVSNGGVLVYEESVQTPDATTGNCYQGIEENMQVIARAVTNRERLDEFLTNINQRF